MTLQLYQGGLLDKSDLDLGIQYDGSDVQYDNEEVTYESEVHVEDVHLGDANVYFNVGLESESEHSEVLSLPSTSEETVTVTVRISFYYQWTIWNHVFLYHFENKIHYY